MKIVVSLGGSTFVKEEVDTGLLKELKELLKKNKNQFCIVTGGGRIARYYSEAGRELGLSGRARHVLGRDVTLINAQLLACYLGADYYYGKPENIAKKWKNKLIVTGGYTPGWNTDVGSSRIAAEARALMINVTNVAYVYDKDPKIGGAKPVREIDWQRMKKIVGKKFTPGMNSPLHPEAVRTCAERGVKLLFMNTDNFKKYLRTEAWEGTTISDLRKN